MAVHQNEQPPRNDDRPQDAPEGTSERHGRAVKKNHGQQLIAFVLLLVVLLLGCALWLLLRPVPDAPAISPIVATPRLPIPPRPAPISAEQTSAAEQNAQLEDPVADVSEETATTTGQTVPAEDAPKTAAASAEAGSAEPAVPQKPELFQVRIGPVIRDPVLQRIRTEVEGHGEFIKEIPGSGLVTMIRLREGRYAKADAAGSLRELKEQIPAAFMLPAGDQLELFVGSYRDPRQAEQMQERLARQGGSVEAVETTLEMSGTLLQVSGLTRAEATRMTRLGTRERVTVIMSPQPSEER